MKLWLHWLGALVLVVHSNTVFSNERHFNFDGQALWASKSSSPAVEVTIKGRYVYAQFIDDNKFPAIRLKRFNANLLNEYTEDFIKLQDYNKDGYLDIAVLKSAGYGGSNLCYSVFKFLPDFYTYEGRKSLTVCDDVLNE